MRLLKDDYGRSKGMAFCEFETEEASDEVYNNADGWEIGGRWLNLDKLRPKSGAAWRRCAGLWIKYVLNSEPRGCGSAWHGPILPLERPYRAAIAAL